MPRLLSRSSPCSRAAYLLLVLLGCYAVTWTFTGFAAINLSYLGLARSEAAIFSSLIAFVFYPALALVTLAAAKPVRLWVVLATASVLLEITVRTWSVS